MSRIGREPITIPAGVTVTVAEGNVVTVKGKLGEVTETFNPGLGINVDGATLTVTRPCDDKEYRALHGLTRALIANMVKGVTEGFSKKLEIVGVGYKVEKQGKKIVLKQKVDSAVLGGLRVEIEGKLLDGTVMGRLTDLRKKVSETVL